MLDLVSLHPKQRKLLTRDEYERLCGQGAFSGMPRMELLRGVLVEMGEQSEQHARVCAWFHEVLVRALDRGRFEVRSHTSYAATADSVPEPDVHVLKRSLRRRLPRQTLLLIEVTQTSHTRDRKIKPPIYGENRAPEYWIVDLPKQIVDVCTKPTRSGYAHVERFEMTDVLRPVKLPGISIAVADIPWLPLSEPKRKRRRGGNS